MAMRLTRALVAAALAIGVCAGSMATGEPPALEDYAYDGVTTYCYWVAQGLQVDRLSYTYVKAEGKNSECPLTMKLTQLTSGVVKAGGDVEYQIDATLNFNSNKFNMTALQALVYDPAGRQVQIPHANVHACSRATVCDVFRDGNNRRISTQETSNFTTGGVAKFTQKVTFQRAGDYNVFAHIALPPKNPMNESYHFLTFFTTSIADVTATTEATSTGMSTGTTVGIVVGGVIGVILIVVVVIFYRRRSVPMTPGHEHFRHSGGGFAPSHTSKHHTSKLDWNGDPDFQFGHDRYQASSMASEFKQPPGLSATSLMFKDRSSRVTKQKTVSSSGSSHRNSSPRGLGGGGYDNYRSGSRTSNYPADMAAIQLPEQHGIATYDTYYDDHAGYSNGYGNDMQSFTTEGSVGTGRGHGYAGNPIYGGYDDHRTGSSYNANPGYGYDDHDRHLGTGASLRPVSEVSRGSEASIGTVDFGLPKGYQHPALRPTGDSFRAEDVPNLADTQLTFNDAEVSKQTVEYIDSLRSQQQYRPSDQASDYVSDFGSTTHTFDFRDSTQSSSDYMASYRSTDHQFTDTNYQRKKRNQSDADSESYEF